MPPVSLSPAEAEEHLGTPGLTAAWERVVARVAGREEAEPPMHNLIPQWLARPAAVLSTLAALTGAGLICWSAVTGGYWWAIWGVASFAVAGLLWHVADYAAATPPGGTGPPEGP